MLDMIVCVPPLVKPIQVAAGGWHACALDAEGVKCWGSNSFGESDVPPLNQPKRIASGARYSCAFDLDGVKCWGKWTQFPSMVFSQ